MPQYHWQVWDAAGHLRQERAAARDEASLHDNASDDGLAPARGLILGLMISSVFWMAAGFGVWRLLHG
jgi:hypothetical protein